MEAKKVSFEGMSWWCREGTSDRIAIQDTDFFQRQEALRRAEESRNGIASGWCVDVGGHIGVFAARYKERFPLSRVIAFEPHLESAELFALNLRENNIRDVTLIQAAIAGQDELVTLYEGRDELGHSIVSENSSLDGRQLRAVIAFSLDTVREVFRLPRISFLKLNCEGAELEILERVSEETLRVIDAMYVELHFDVIEVALKQRIDMLQRLQDAGLAVSIFSEKKKPGVNEKKYLVGTRGRSRPFRDGYVVADFDEQCI